MRLSLIVFGLLVLTSFETDVKLGRVKVTPEISVLVPKEFKPMDDLDFGQRYPSVRKPVAAYTNYERNVDFSINISATQWPDTDIELAQKFFKAGLFNLFDNLEMFNEGIHEVHKKKFIFFEFESRIKGDPRDMALREPVLNYTYIQYLVEPGRTLVFTFNCPRRMRPDWQEAAKKMMTSIKMK